MSATAFAAVAALAVIHLRKNHKTRFGVGVIIGWF